MERDINLWRTRTDFVLATERVSKSCYGDPHLGRSEPRSQNVTNNVSPCFNGESTRPTHTSDSMLYIGRARSERSRVMTRHHHVITVRSINSQWKRRLLSNTRRRHLQLVGGGDPSFFSRTPCPTFEWWIYRDRSLLTPRPQFYMAHFISSQQEHKGQSERSRL